MSYGMSLHCFGVGFMSLHVAGVFVLALLLAMMYYIHALN